MPNTGGHFGMDGMRERVQLLGGNFDVKSAPNQGTLIRESEILKLVGRGLTNREIGEQFHLSEKTIKHYITNILQKLHVRSRVEAAMPAVRGSRGNTIN